MTRELMTVTNPELHDSRTTMNSDLTLSNMKKINPETTKNSDLVRIMIHEASSRTTTIIVYSCNQTSGQQRGVTTISNVAHPNEFTTLGNLVNWDEPSSRPGAAFQKEGAPDLHPQAREGLSSPGHVRNPRNESGL